MQSHAYRTLGTRYGPAPITSGARYMRCLASRRSRAPRISWGDPLSLRKTLVVLISETCTLLGLPPPARSNLASLGSSTAGSIWSDGAPEGEDVTPRLSGGRTAPPAQGRRRDPDPLPLPRRTTRPRPE